MKKSITALAILFCLTRGLVAAVPEGYTTATTTIPVPPETQSGVFACDSQHNLYYGHATGTKSEQDVKSGRGSSSEIWTYNSVSGTHTLFYASPAVSAGDYGMNSVAGMWIDETTTPWTYYIADQEPVKGSPWTTGGVWRARDLTANGDLLDAGDLVELMTIDLTTLIYASDVIRDDVSGDLFVTHADGIAGHPMVYRLSDDDESGYIESGEMYSWALLPADGNYAGGLCFGTTTDVIFTHDTSGSVYRLEDINDDGDALDSGERVLFASLPIAGGYHIAMDTDGDLFVSASDWSTMTHALYQITTDATPVVSLFHDLTGQVGFCGKFAFGGSQPFEPYQPNGAVLYLSYSTTSWLDPTDILTFQPEASSVETPATSFYGLLILVGIMSWICRKHR